MSASAVCELCEQPGGDVVYRDQRLRVVLVDDANYPGFCRVIWNAHAKEMSDLPPHEREMLMSAVWKVEEALREAMNPDKINLASLGNVVPHLHWHVIPRVADDAHFPSPVWAQVQRSSPQAAQRALLLPQLREALAQKLGVASEKR